ncbi:MAG: HD domain-containing protein [Eubacterium sp.]|nr:HD domain-containing protein [Eubacterium sp.]
MKMKKRDVYRCMFVVCCILLNIIGKIVATEWQLPLWLDSCGTIISAYALGPVSGAIIGASVNILYAIVYGSTHLIFAVVSMVIAIIIGLCAQKGKLEYLFGVLSVSFLVALLCVCVSTMCNFLLFDGSVGNVWGDGIQEFFMQYGVPRLLAHVIAEFYLEFTDKTVSLFSLYLTVKIYRIRKRKKIEKIWNQKKAERSEYRNSRKATEKYMLGILLALCLTAANLTPVCAAQRSNFVQNVDEYASYLQTIYDKEDNLPGGVANDIAQTKDGVLWIGTYSGLYRYTGRDFQLMDRIKSVKNVNCLYTDESGRMWIGTNDSGLSIYIDGSITNVLDKNNGLPSDSVRCMTQSTDGDYYVGTTSSLAIVSISSGLYVKQVLEDIVYARSVCADAQGNVAVVTDDGTLYLIQNQTIVDKVTLTEGGYKSCIFDETNRLYAATSGNEVHKYQINVDVLTPNGRMECGALMAINSMSLTEDGKMFLCADNGIGYWDQEEVFHEIHASDFNSSIEHMLIDYQGNLWFTSSRQGLLRLCKSAFCELADDASVNQMVVNTTCGWNDYLLIGGDSGLQMMDAAGAIQKEHPLVEQMKNVRIRCMKTDSRGHLWICTSGKGLFEVEKDATVHQYDEKKGTNGNKFRSVIETTDGFIVAAGDKGLTFLKNGEVVNTIGLEQGMENPKVLCLLEHRDGSILAGTDGNGIVEIRDGKIERVFTKEDGLGSEVILRIVEEQNGKNYYFVTSNGISYMDAGGTIRLVERFPYYNNYDLVEGADGMIFVLSSAGIYVMDRENLLGNRTPKYELLNEQKGLNKGLTPNAWNYVDENNNLYLSTEAGVSYINLDHYKLEVRSYRMLMKNIQVDNALLTVERGETIRIARGAKQIVFLPEILSYTADDPYVSVWLEGYDEVPQTLLRSELEGVKYVNLPTGEYTFHMSIISNSGNYSVAESTYDVVKEREIYDYWWFRVYLIVIFALFIIYLTWLIFRMQIQRTLELKNKELEFVKKQVEMGNEAILTIAQTVDAKDENTSQHSIRVSEYSVLIAERLGFNEQECSELKKTALLHDIGKIAIPDRVLNKPDRLTDAEYEIMKSHVTKGANILKNFKLIDRVDEGALYHHERYDGRGYVYGLKGEEIPIRARIISLADAFDAMTANRVYRKRLDMEQVLGELERGRGTQFDPVLVDILLNLIDEGVVDAERLCEEVKQ